MFVSDTKKLNLVGVCIACVALPLDTDGSGPETITQQRRPWLRDYDPSELSSFITVQVCSLFRSSNTSWQRECSTATGKEKSIPCLIK